MERSKQVLGVSISPHLYQKLKKECSGKNVSAFVEKAIAKELVEKEKERKEFQKKLIAGYKAQVENKRLQKELRVMEKAQFEDLKDE
jgi:post-segregation antitoxin (ccd killing protein)